MEPSEVIVTLSPALRSMPVSVHCLSAGTVKSRTSADVVVIVVTVAGAVGAGVEAAGVLAGTAAGVTGAGVVSAGEGVGVADCVGGVVCDLGWNPGAGASCAIAEAEQSSVRRKGNRRFMLKHTRRANDSTMALPLNTGSESLSCGYSAKLLSLCLQNSDVELGNVGVVARGA
jgi:hypothetical protein